MDILNYIDKMQEMYEGKPSSMAQEPRNMADGGRIIGKPGGVVEPGVMYYGKNVMSGSPAQQAENIRRQEESLKKISKLFKKKDYTGLKTKTPIARIKQGMNDGGGKLNTAQLSQITKAIDGGLKTQNAFAKKLGITRKELLEGIEKSKSKISLEKSEKLSKQQLKKVEFQEKLFKEIVDNPNATIDSMTNKFKVDKKYLVSQSSKLLKNVYSQNVSIAKGPEFDLDSRGKATLKSWLPDDFNTTEKFLDRFSNIDGFKKIQAENMGILIKNAYAKTNPKKYADAMKTLTEYNNFKNNLPKGLKVDLDHPLSKVFLKGSGVSPDKLLYVTPVNRDFNRGFKMQMGNRYAKALLQGDKTAIKNVKALADKLKINIGGVKGSKLDFGTTKFDTKKNFGKEYLANIKEQAAVSDNLNKLQKTKEGKQLIKDAGFKSGQIKQIKKVNKKQIKIVTNLVGKLACPTAKFQLGGRVNFSNGSSCNVKGRKILDRIIATGKGTDREISIAKKLLNFGKESVSLRGLFGPQATALFALTEAGLTGYDVAKGKPLKEAIGKNLNYLLGPKWEQDVDELEYKRLEGSGVDINQLKLLKNSYKDFEKLGELFNTQYSLEQNKGNPQGRSGMGSKGTQKSRAQRLQEVNSQINDMYMAKGPQQKSTLIRATEIQNDPSILANRKNAIDILAAQEADRSILPEAGSAFADERRRKEREKQRLALQTTDKEVEEAFGFNPNGVQTFSELNKLMSTMPEYADQSYGITKVGPQTGQYNVKNAYNEARKYLDSLKPEFGYYGTQEGANVNTRYAGGGIARLSGGDTSGPPPESGPMSQGLRSLYKNGRKL